MLDFEPYSLESLKKVMPYLKTCPYRVSDLSAGALLMWQEGANTQFCVWQDTFVIRRNFGEQPAFSWPFGKNPDGMLDELLAYVKAQDFPLRFFVGNDETLEMIRQEKRFSSVMAAYDRKWSDYLYDYEEMCTFRGKKFSGQRNHINKFTKLYGTPQVRFLQCEDAPALQEMLTLYQAEHKDANAMEQTELTRTKQLLTHYKDLELLAACLTVDGKIAAFSIGEVVGDMLIIHVEKALKSYQGAYPTMYQGFVRLVRETVDKELSLVNREEDTGDPGLRTSKQQYQPIGMVNKYLIHVNSPAANVETLPVIHQGGVVLTPFFERDKAAYLELNTDVENNRYWGYDYREDISITLPVDEQTFYDAMQFDNRTGDSINFAVRETEDGELIGEVILWNFTWSGSVEIGCRLLPGYQKKGYGKTAFALASDFAEETLSLRPRARCFLQNQPSYRMITASGFVKTGKDETYYYFERK